MKELLTHGKYYNKLYKVICKECNCKFVYTKSEIIINDEIDYVTCPECNAKNVHIN